MSSSRNLIPLILWVSVVGCSVASNLGENDGGAEDAMSMPGVPYDECGNGMDDDEDGTIDEGCPCGLGETQSCFSGSYPFRGVGACFDGTQSCVIEVGVEFGRWGACTADRVPGEQSCDGTDGDCDGAVDEGCSCTAGETQECGVEFLIVPCQGGTQTCTSEGVWTGCEGAVGPAAEVCTDEIDNDCDGEVNEGCDCVPVPEICEDGVDNDCDGQLDEPNCAPPLLCPGMGGSSCAPVEWTEPGLELGVSRTAGDVGLATLVQQVARDGATTLAGHFRESIDLGTGPLTSLGSSDFFLARYSRDWTPTWVRRFGGNFGAGCTGRLCPTGETISDIALTPDGNVAVVGRFDGHGDLGAGTVGAEGGHHVFIALYSGATGDLLWSDVYGGRQLMNQTDAHSVAVDSDGNVHAAFTMRIEGAFDLGGTSVAPAAGELSWSGFALASYDGSGAHRWSRFFESPSFVPDNIDIAAGCDGLYVGGDYSWGGSVWTMDFGGGPQPVGRDDEGVFVVRLNPADGTHRWTHTTAQPLGFRPRATDSRELEISSDGGVWHMGWAQAGIDFGGGALTTPPGSGLRASFLVAYESSDGSHRASTLIPTEERPAEVPPVEDLALGPDGVPHLFGRGPVVLPTGTLGTENDAFVVALSADLTAVTWSYVRPVTPNPLTTIRPISVGAVDNCGNVFGTTWTGDVTVDGISYGGPTGNYLALQGLPR